MPSYQFYCQDADRLIASGGWIHANSDPEAIAFAKAKKIEAACEVWLGNRLVAELAAYSGGSTVSLAASSLREHRDEAA
jgi:hypothetical protein